MKKNYSNEIDFNNLQRMYDYLLENKERIKPLFNIEEYRHDLDDTSPVCTTLGCVLGHGTGAFTVDEIPLYGEDEGSGINYYEFSEFILKIEHKSDLWHFLFSGFWKGIEPTLNEALLRMKWVIRGNDFEKYHSYLELQERRKEFRKNRY